MVELVRGLYHMSSGGDQGKFLKGEPVYGLHVRSLRVVKLVMKLHHGSSMVVKLEVGLH